MLVYAVAIESVRMDYFLASFLFLSGSTSMLLYVRARPAYLETILHWHFATPRDCIRNVNSSRRQQARRFSCRLEAQLKPSHFTGGDSCSTDKDELTSHVAHRDECIERRHGMLHGIGDG